MATILSRALRRALSVWPGARSERRPDHRPSDEPINRSLAEAALSRADMASVRTTVLADMTRMMRHFNVEPRYVPHRFWRRLSDAERICAHCLTVGRCRRWFHRQSADDAPRLFCPNAELFDEIAIAQRRAPEPRKAPPA